MSPGQPDISTGNVYVRDGQVLYLNGFHGKEPEHLGFLVRPRSCSVQILL